MSLTLYSHGFNCSADPASLIYFQYTIIYAAVWTS